MPALCACLLPRRRLTPFPSSHSSGDYELAEAEGIERGTKIVLHLKDDAHSFASQSTLESIIRKYSNFVSFPIRLNGTHMNTVRALWTMDQADVSEEDFTEFYRYISSACVHLPRALRTHPSRLAVPRLGPRCL